MNGIDPKITYWFGIWTSILLGVAGLGPQFFDGALPAAYIPIIVKWCAILGFLNSMILTGGSGFSSSKPGPLVSGSAPPITPTIVKILIAAFVLSAFLAVPPAQAQVKRQQGPIEQFVDKARQDLASKTIEAVQAQSNPSSNALQQFADFISGDISGAADLAISIPDTLDGNAQICFDAMSSAGKVFQANPIPTTADVNQGVVTAFERLRLLAMTANRVCQMSSCTQIFADASGALSALAPIKMPIPNVHDICAMIPNVAVAKPTRVLPASSSTPVPAAVTPSATPVPTATPTP